MFPMKSFNPLKPSDGFGSYAPRGPSPACKVAEVNARRRLRACKQDTIEFDFINIKNGLRPTVKINGLGPEDNITPDLGYELHAIIDESDEWAREMHNFFELATGAPATGDWHRIREEHTTHTYSTRSITTRRGEREQWRREKMRALATPSLATSTHIIDHPPHTTTFLAKLPEEIRQMVYLYAIEVPFCGCPFCCDGLTIRHLMNLSQTTRDSLVRLIESQSNHAMRYFAGMPPVPADLRQEMVSRIETNTYARSRYWKAYAFRWPEKRDRRRFSGLFFSPLEMLRSHSAGSPGAMTKMNSDILLMSRTPTPEIDPVPLEVDQANTREYIRQWNYWTKRTHCARKHDDPYLDFSRTRNFVLPYMRCSNYGPDCRRAAVRTPNPTPNYYPHAVELDSSEEAEDLRKFLSAATESRPRWKSLKVERWFKDTIGEGGHNTRARAAERDAHKLQIERRLQLIVADSSALVSIKAMKDQGEKSPVIDWTPLERLPNEIQTMICRYAIEDTSCACPYCCDRNAIRRLYNLSAKTRDNLMKVIELEGNHAMKWFVGMDPASPTQAI